MFYSYYSFQLQGNIMQPNNLWRYVLIVVCIIVQQLNYNVQYHKGQINSHERYCYYSLMLLLYVCKILFTLLRRVSRHKYALRDSVNAVFSTTKAFLFCFQFTIVLNIHNRGTLETMHSSSYYAKTLNTGIRVSRHMNQKLGSIKYLNIKINLHQ